MRVAYRDEPAIGITVNLIRSWKRGEITPVSSASSGLKDYVFNHVWRLFEELAFAARIVMVRGEYSTSPPFLLIADSAGRWFDVLAREVVVS